MHPEKGEGSERESEREKERERDDHFKNTKKDHLKLGCQL